MKNKEIRDVLVSAFLDAELTVRVVAARSTESIYLTASNGRLPYTIRIANHRSSNRYSTIDDYWIDTNKEDVVPMINGALRGAERRFNVPIHEYVPPAPAQVSEVCDQIPDNYAQSPEQNMIDLAQYYISEGYFVPEVNVGALQAEKEEEFARAPVPLVPVWSDSTKDSARMAWFIVTLLAVCRVLYCLAN